VLDEATSALDAANQERIGAALARLHGRVTVLLIAHRSSLVEQADQVVVLAAGRVSERQQRTARPTGRQAAIEVPRGYVLSMASHR
jgi:ABC-type bacteriocin/lantibiotic exporter with double-glycine peptidase domain